MKKNKASILKLNENIWPLERDVLFRPDRLKYVRKLIKPQGCVFCHAVKSETSYETLGLYKSKYSMVILNKFPYNPGHILVVPQRHIGDLTQMNAVESQDLHETLMLAMNAIKAVFSPGGMNVGMNHGAVAGAGIPEHLHWHIVPRWSGDLNFFPLIAETKVSPQSLEETYQLLSKYFISLQKKTNKKRNKS